MQAAALGGVHGQDGWLETLKGLIAAEPVPDSLPAALEPVRALGTVDVDAVLRAAKRRLKAPAGAWHPEDWRNSHPEFPEMLALTMHVYTLQDPNVYTPLGDALHGADRASGPGGVSPAGKSTRNSRLARDLSGVDRDRMLAIAVRAWLPFAKLLDMALEESVRVFAAVLPLIFARFSFTSSSSFG